MKKLILNSLAITAVSLAALALTSGCCALKGGKDCPTGKCGIGPGKVKMEDVKEAEISTESLQVLVRSGAPLILLDARTGKFDDGNRIPGAKSLSPQADKAMIEKLLPSKDSLIVTYCSNLQCPASSHLAERLHNLGYKNILEYRPGIAGWIESGNKVVSVK